MFTRLRVEENTNYTKVSNEFVRDQKLSLKAKGLLLVVMSLPKNWDFSIEGLAAIVKESRNTVNTILAELTRNGYYYAERIRDKGRFIGTDFIFSEYRNPKPQKDKKKSPQPKKPYMEEPSVEKPYMEDCRQISKDSNKEKTTNKERERTLSGLASREKSNIPTLEEIKAYKEQIHSSVDAEKFYNHFESVGWMQSGNRPIVRWKPLFNNWTRTERNKPGIEEHTRKVDLDYERFKAMNP